MKLTNEEAAAILDRILPLNEREVDSAIEAGAAALRRVERIQGELNIANQIGDTFWEALKLAKLTAIDVANPGRHVAEIIIQRDKALRRLDWLRTHALFGCAECYDTYSLPASDLRIAPSGKLYCQNCWPDCDEAWNGDERGADWSDLPEFNPFEADA